MRNLLLTIVCLVASVVYASPRTLVLDRKAGSAIAPTMYGVFFEDINYAADGGLYAELVQNRSFEFPDALQGWQMMGNVVIDTVAPAFARNPHYASLRYAGHPHEATGLFNHGFFGIGLRAGMDYDLSLYARSHAGKAAVLLLELSDRYQNILAHDTLRVSAGDWQRYACRLHTAVTEEQGVLRLRLLAGEADIDHVSLMPTDAVCGLRRDLVETLRDLHPAIFRFPGGCIVEGTQLDSRYQWKNSVGPAENRPLNKNRWNNTFDGRYAPNYFQSYGLGFYEYFVLCEQIGASPIPVVSVGLSCQFHNHAESDYASQSELDSYIQDALDLIAFANADTTNEWGRLRATMGHPAPFGLRILGIGNEQWGEPYTSRLEPFLTAIRAQYPEIEIVGSSGPFPNGEDFDYGWQHMRRLRATYVDEHYYQSPEWFLENVTRYDSYDRRGPRVFAGEYAAHVEREGGYAPATRNTFGAALAEAAYMTGLERNADIVRMTAYAPLFANMNAWQWDPDLIWFDNLSVVRTPNYYVQQLFASQPGTHMLGITENKKPLTGQDGLYASAAYDAAHGARIVRLINTADASQTIRITCPRSPLAGKAEVVRLHAGVGDYNDAAHPNRVQPERMSCAAEDGVLTLTLDPQTIYVLTINN